MAFTITVRLKSDKLTLESAEKNDDGQTLSPLRHRIFTGKKVEWICHEGDLFIAFYEDLLGHPDKPEKEIKVVLHAVKDAPTKPPLKMNGGGTDARYLVAVLKDGKTTGVCLDPILEDGGDPIEVGKKKSAKKAAKKKPKKK